MTKIKILKEIDATKAKEELNALKEEVETLSRKLRELTDEELAQVTGGAVPESNNKTHTSFAYAG